MIKNKKYLLQKKRALDLGRNEKQRGKQHQERANSNKEASGKIQHYNFGVKKVTQQILSGRSFHNFCKLLTLQDVLDLIFQLKYWGRTKEEQQ